MMPTCQYKKCSKVAYQEHTHLLEKWSTYDFRTSPSHVQAIWLCNKHIKKINNILQLEEK